MTLGVTPRKNEKIPGDDISADFFWTPELFFFCKKNFNNFKGCNKNHHQVPSLLKVSVGGNERVLLASLTIGIIID
jgi:hypothetical protein